MRTGSRWSLRRGRQAIKEKKETSVFPLDSTGHACPRNQIHPGQVNYQGTERHTFKIPYPTRSFPVIIVTTLLTAVVTIVRVVIAALVWLLGGIRRALRSALRGSLGGSLRGNFGGSLRGFLGAVWRLACLAGCCPDYIITSFTVLRLFVVGSSCGSGRGILLRGRVESHRGSRRSGLLASGVASGCSRFVVGVVTPTLVFVFRFGS